MRSMVCIAALPVLLGAGLTLADMGSIPFEPHVQIFEPNQRALIAWNGKEQILILSTDLRASKPTKVLEVIPLPSKPVVKGSDVKVFRRAITYINRKLRARPGDREESAGTLGAEGGGRSAPPPPAGEVTFHKTIGATDVSVTRVLRPEGFVDWVEKYLRARKVKKPEIPEPMKKVVQEYLTDGYTWFVFNVVALDTKPRTKQAIKYRFKSKCIYYPLRITRTESGRTSVQLLILTRRLVNRYTFTGIGRRDVTVAHTPVDLNENELLSLGSDLYALLGRPRSAKIRIWEIEGKLSDFAQDLLAGRPRRFYLKREKTGKMYGPFGFLPGTRVKLGSQTFTIKADDRPRSETRDTFWLKNIRFSRPYGPFEFVDGARLVLHDVAFTLICKEPEAAKPGKRSR